MTRETARRTDFAAIRHQVPLIFVALACLAGCDAQHDSAYPGDPLYTISGLVEASSSSAPPPGVDVVVAYVPAKYDSFPPCLLDVLTRLMNGTADGANLDCPIPVVAERAQVTGEFPARFQLDLLHPPPPEALSDDGGFPVALALLYAARAGSAVDHVLTFADLMGYTSARLLYVGGDVPPPAAPSCHLSPAGERICEPSMGTVPLGFVQAADICAGKTIPPEMQIEDCLVASEPGSSITIHLADPATVIANQEYHFGPAGTPPPGP